MFCFQTDGSTEGQKAGWVRFNPDAANSSLIGFAVFSFNPAGVLTSESRVPSVLVTTHVRVFVDLMENHNTGLA
jgi:hypothetical protein